MPRPGRILPTIQHTCKFNKLSNNDIESNETYIRRLNIYRIMASK